MYSVILPCVLLLMVMKSAMQRCAAMLHSPTPPACMQTFTPNFLAIRQTTRYSFSPASRCTNGAHQSECADGTQHCAKNCGPPVRGCVLDHCAFGPFGGGLDLDVGLKDLVPAGLEVLLVHHLVRDLLAGRHVDRVLVLRSQRPGRLELMRQASRRTRQRCESPESP